ncbi:Protein DETOXIFICATION 12 [Glycine soja]
MNALRTVLLWKLDNVEKNDKCQITMISTWRQSFILATQIFHALYLSIGLVVLVGKKTMEENLLAKQREKQKVTWDGLGEEMKRIICIAVPMVIVTATQYLLQVVSIMMVGHLNNNLYLSGAALAISLATVTGFSVLAGMASGLETICGQAYGAQQYEKVGVQTYTAIFSLTVVCLPLTFIWISMEKILVFIGQDPLIAQEAGKFLIWLVPALFAHAIMQPFVRYFQMQSLLLPMLISSCVTLCIHIPLCWALVFQTGMNNIGGALAMSISIWLNVTFLGLYMRYSPACAKTRAPISMELFQGIWEFFRFAIPSAVMICLEWWSFELLILLSGLLPNPQLETSVLSICLNTISTLFSIPFGIAAAASTRISNELGAGNPHAAHVAVLAAMSFAIMETAIVSGTLFVCRHDFGYIFSNEKEVVDYVTVMAPLICISVILDSIQGVLAGIARGCGWQHLGVYVNLGAFYLCGIPMAALLAFLVRLGGKGLWIGIQSGAFVQCILLSIITGCINWEKQAIKARKRLFDEKISADNILIRTQAENPSASATTWTVFSLEMKRVGYLAGPMITVTLSQYFLQIISMVMVGHLGKLALSSTAIAISLCAVSGFSLIFAMSSALETQCGQAYGAHQYRKFGVQMYTAIVSLTLASLPLGPLWVYLGKILIFLGQDPLISQEAGKFALCMTPALFDYATLQALVRYFLMQRAAFFIGTSYWLNVILLGLYMKFSIECKKTRVPISTELFHGIGEFFRCAIPSAGMICLSVTTTIYTIPEAIGSAASTRVSNALGGGSPQLAQVSVSAAMTLAASAAILVSSIIFACRQVVGYAFSNELDVVDYFTEMVPLLSISVILDTLHDTLSGIARGCGWQHRGAYVNLDAYYVVGIPIAAILGFCLQLRGKGLWIGILTGAFCQTVMVSLITSCTNWEKQAIKAWERIFQRNFDVEDGLVLANGEDSLNLSASFVGIGKSSSFGGRKDQILGLEEEKDVLREMKELKPVSCDDQVDEAAGEGCAEAASEPHDDNSSEGDLGNDLSPEEMKVAERAIEVVSNTLSVRKVLIHSIIGLLKLEKPNDNSGFINSLEKLLQLCQELGRQIDEIGACLYPPQEIPAINAALEEIHSIIDAVQVEVGELLGASDVFLEACNDLRSSLRQLASELRNSSTADIEARVENITLT